MTVQIARATALPAAQHLSSRRGKALASVSALAFLCGLPAAAAAQERGTQLDEIVVTAQKREQSLQDVPIAVSAITQDTLTANRITTVKDLNSIVPNLQVRTQVGGGGLPIYTIRGLVALGSAAGGDKGIALYVDGVYQSASYGSILEVAEVSRIEVLRGPQGTLFGRNSTGGAISISTPEPTGEFSVKQSVTVGNYDQLRSVTRLNTGDAGGLSASFTYGHSERRGDIRNLGAGTRWDLTTANGGKPTILTSPKYLGGDNTEAVLAAIKFERSDRFSALLRLDWEDRDTGAPPLGSLYQQPSVRAIMAAQPNQAILTQISRKRPKAVNNGDGVDSEVKGYGGSLTVNYRLADNVSLKNILAYRHTEFSNPWIDVVGLGGLINTGGPAFVAVLGPALAASTVGQPFLVQGASTSGIEHQWSNELQLNVDTKLVTLTAGALYFEKDELRAPFGADINPGRARAGAFRVYPGGVVPFLGQAIGAGGRPTLNKIRSYAGYGYGEFHLTSQLDVVGGIRWTRDFKKSNDNSVYNLSAIPPITFVGRYEDDRITFNLGANYKLTPDMMVYGKYATGYISGGSLAGINYAAETAKSWEGGLKADWLNNTLRTNIAVFSVKYGNLQFPTSGASLTPPNPAITQALVNAGDAKAQGFEVETTWRPIRGLTFNGGLGYTDFKYLSLLTFVTAPNVEFLAQYRPKWTANLAAQYDSDPVFGDAYVTARLDANYHSKQSALGGVPASLSPVEQVAYKAAASLPAYWIVNGRVALQGFKVAGADATVALWGKNLLNNKSLAYAISFVTSISGDYERARTVGVDLTIEF